MLVQQARHLEVGAGGMVGLGGHGGRTTEQN